MRKREQRRWKRAERGAQAGGDPDAEPCNHEEFFGDREAPQTAAGETKDMLQPQRKADSEAEETQSEEQIAEVEILVEDSGGLGNIQIGADPENSELVEVPWEDPYAQEDADKENWDPQILREAVRDRVLAQAEGA